jgi:hypothetical protein
MGFAKICITPYYFSLLIVYSTYLLKLPYRADAAVLSGGFIIMAAVRKIYVP